MSSISHDAVMYVAGHRGLVGSAIVRKLQSLGFTNIVSATSREVDLRDAQAVKAFYQQYKPEYVIVAAAKVGGIHANDIYPAEFLYENLMIEANLIHGAYEAGVEKLLFLGSTCIYPKLAPQPLKEEYLLTGPLEPTNEWYAIAKIAGVKLCQAYAKQYGCRFISAMPTNLYGPGDNFDLNNSHVLPALMRKVHEAKENNAPNVTVWGSGKPKREFLHVDDCAAACMHLLENYENTNEWVNIGVGDDISIADLAMLMKEVVGYSGDIIYDSSKPDGTPRKLVDVTRINNSGWSAKIALKEGVAATYQWYLDQR